MIPKRPQINRNNGKVGKQAPRQMPFQAFFLREGARRDIKIFSTIHVQSTTFTESLARHHRLQIVNDLFVIAVKSGIL